MHATAPYINVIGNTIASDWTDLTDGNLTNPIQRTETGTLLPGGEMVWTGTEADGTASATNCNGWMSNAAADSGVSGVEGQTTSGWSGNVDSECTESFHLYCFEQ